MAKPLTELTIFISSPGNLNAERVLIEQTIESLSQSVKASYGVVLKVLKWEQDVVPGLGPSPQDIINSQIKSDYDIYIGLLGTYFGSPTTNWASGTEEEYRIAYDRYLSAPESIRVLFYFKEYSDNVFSIDVEQLQKVISFRNEIAKHSIYGTFSDQDNLAKSVTSHMHNLLSSQWDGEKWKSISPILVQPSTQNLSLAIQEEIEDEETEEEGFLECLALALEHSRRINQIMNQMTEDANAFNLALTSRTTDIEDAMISEDTHKQIAIYDDLAEIIMNYEKRFRVSIPEASLALEGSFDYYLKLKKLVSSDFPQAQQAIDEAGESIATLSNTVRRVREGIKPVRETISQIPPFTRNLRIAKRRLADAYDLYIASITVFITKYDLSLEDK